MVLRQHLATVAGSMPLFAEGYACGAIRLYGLVDKGAEVPRACDASSNRPST
jgi:hypothetical protein